MVEDEISINSHRLAHTLKQAAEISNIGLSRIYEALGDTESGLTAVKNGSRTLILHDVLLNWMRSLPPAEFGKHRGVKGRARRNALEAA